MSRFFFIMALLSVADLKGILGAKTNHITYAWQTWCEAQLDPLAPRQILKEAHSAAVICHSKVTPVICQRVLFLTGFLKCLPSPQCTELKVRA